MKILEVKDSDFDNDCGDYLEGEAAKKFVEENYTHMKEEGHIYSAGTIIKHDDGTYSVSVGEDLEDSVVGI